MNIILHAYKPYKKGNTFITLWFITLIKYDVLTTLEKAGKKIVNDLYINPKLDAKSRTSRNSKERIGEKI